MNWLDYSLIAILFVMTFLGLWSGLWWQLYRIACLALSYFLAVRYYGIGLWLAETVFDEETAKLVGCVLVFTGVFIATYLLGRLIRAVFGTGPGMFGRLIGAAIGLLKGALVCSIVAFCLTEYNIVGGVTKREELKKGTVTGVFARAGDLMATYIVPDSLRTNLENLVQGTSVKTKEMASEVSRLREMAREIKQYKKETAESNGEDRK